MTRAGRQWRRHPDGLREQVVVRITEDTRDRALLLADAEGVAEAQVLRRALEVGLSIIEAERKGEAA